MLNFGLTNRLVQLGIPIQRAELPSHFPMNVLPRMYERASVRNYLPSEGAWEPFTTIQLDQ